MADFHFDYLTGTISVPAAAPEEWHADGLGAFYAAPNDEAWGATLCRVLYHESIHAWQLFSSGYLANLVGDEWRRLLRFEETGEVAATSDALRDHKSRLGDHPFSAAELVECWARYWDVHTRGPNAIIRDEELTPPADAVLAIVDPATGTPSYTAAAYDFLMRHGALSSSYERPYTWLLDRAGGDSATVAITFPVLAHAAFGSPNPVGMLMAAFERAIASPAIAAAMAQRTGNINLDWLGLWGPLRDEAILPTLDEMRLPSFTSGFDVIERGILSSHPIYPEYRARLDTLSGLLQLARRNLSALATNGGASGYQVAVLEFPTLDPWVVFGLPGQPDYRWLLGESLTPVRVRFANYELTARRPVMLRLQEMRRGVESEESYAERATRLEERVARFRRAEYAVSLGLRPDAFEPAAVPPPSAG